MGEFKSRYASKEPDKEGYIEYTQEENDVWRDLYARQIEIVKGRGCDEYLKGLDILQLPNDRIPQIPEMNTALHKATGWGIEPVPALISQERFFELLAERKFPAATFIRSRDDFDYIQEPDIFHEIFGHCPLLTEPVYAEFMRDYAEFVLNIDKKEWPLMQRLYWFTVEFGLMNTKDGLRIYGGGILSSPKETVYCVESDIPKRRPFGNGLDAFRTPYRIDQLQDIYYVIDNYDQLYQFIHSDIDALLKQAHQLGEFPPTFVPDGSGNEHVHFC